MSNNLSTFNFNIMKLFVNKLFIFVIIPLILYLFYSLFITPILLKRALGPNTREQIEVSFQNVIRSNFDLLILGNSRTYRGVNPDKIDIKSYNFSHDNDTYNQLYNKLLFVDKNNKEYEYLVLGLDFFQFSVFSGTRNYVYDDFFGIEYLSDYEEGSSEVDYYLELLKIEKFRESIKLINSKEKPSFIKKNGQYIQYIRPMSLNGIKRDSNKLKLQIDYFEKILDYCKKKKIKVFLCMLPIQEKEKINYSNKIVDDFYKFISGYLNENVLLLNFTDDKNYTRTDYLDVTHFTEASANKFSSQLNDSIIKYTLNK